jgi:hypothetical protein
MKFLKYSCIKDKFPQKNTNYNYNVDTSRFLMDDGFTEDVVFIFESTEEADKFFGRNARQVVENLKNSQNEQYLQGLKALTEEIYAQDEVWDFEKYNIDHFKWQTLSQQKQADLIRQKYEQQLHNNIVYQDMSELRDRAVQAHLSEEEINDLFYVKDAKLERPKYCLIPYFSVLAFSADRKVAQRIAENLDNEYNDYFADKKGCYLIAQLGDEINTAPQM